MKLSEQKVGIMMLKIVGLTILGLIFYIFTHEFSHLITMLLCNGTFVDLQIGVTSFVAGYVEPQFVSFTAMSSLFIPLGISTILFFFKNQYLNVFFLGFTMPSFVYTIMGIFAMWFIHDSTRQTYDVALAYDFAKYPLIIVVLTIVGIIYGGLLLTLGMIRLVKQA